MVLLQWGGGTWRATDRPVRGDRWNSPGPQDGRCVLAEVAVSGALEAVQQQGGMTQG
ncbi:hypothetical protein [Deinococcus ruber]|uniref:Uncharacterized protein n=1 Tax=Deinococcus ruber TaxID=1848197 RepID=A0A918F8F0_9DEIO|nr:hypothetical protein [Deinococcus ruber]GGR15340.1 hypothetical protein GCM10008957_30100 [Deinococcus ruber]